MEANTLVTELPKAADWEVYQDAFAPQQPIRRRKPWDREAVSAHAPRLNGRKIWKKASRSLRSNVSRGGDEAQVELEREGMGARKKMRVAGEKENIADAKWALKANAVEENEAEIVGVISPVKRMGMGLDTTALLVPRKRTNANHLITPRKGTKKIPLLDVTLGRGDNSLGADEPVDVEKASSPRVKKSRRTKSMRKSGFSRLSSGDSLMETSIKPVRTTEDVPEALAETVIVEPEQEAQSSQPVDIFGTSSEGSSQVEVVEVVDASTVFIVDGLEVIQAEDNPVDYGEGPETAEGSDVQQVVDVLPTLTEESEEPEPSMVSHTVLETQPLPSVLTKIEMSLPELSADAIESPKKRRGRNSRTPRASPVKQGTRATRSSSSLPEVLITQAIEEISGPAVEEARSPCKAQCTPRRQIAPITISLPENPTQDNILKSDVPSLFLEPEVLPFPLTVQADHGQPICEDAGIFHAQHGLEFEVKDTFDIDLQLPIEHVQSEDTLPAEAKHTSNVFDDFDIYGTKLPQFGSENKISKPSIVEETGIKLPDDISEASDNAEDLEEITLNLGEVLEAASNELQQNDSTTSNLEEADTNAVEDTTTTIYNQDDTDLLRSFLTRVNANKAAKAAPKRKRSLPHSPIQLPLGSVPHASSPTSPRAGTGDDTVEFTLTLDHESSPSKHHHQLSNIDEEHVTQSRTTRRSGRTRLPVKTAPLAAPSFIPVRRLGGQDGESTVTLRQDADKELASLTKYNTRKNKGGALLPLLVLAKKAEEKTDPAAAYRVLKETFDELAAETTIGKVKNRKGMNVVWAEELVQFQSAMKEMVRETEGVLPLKKEVVLGGTQIPGPGSAKEEKKALRVGVRSRSKIALGVGGIATGNGNGTPAPKRQRKK